jgi:hypothetical protein
MDPYHWITDPDPDPAIFFVQKTIEIKVFQKLLPVDGRIRVSTKFIWIQIQEAQKLTDPVSNTGLYCMRVKPGSTMKYGVPAVILMFNKLTNEICIH